MSEPRTDHARARDAVRSVLAERWPGARIGEIDAVPGDASSRRYLRCRLEPGDVAPARAPAPDTLVVMLTETGTMALSSDELGVFGDRGPSELPFVNVWRFLSRRTSALPELYTVATDGDALVLEDVGDVSLWSAMHDSAGAGAEALLERALDLLAAIQVAAVDDGSGCYAFAQAFDRRLFEWEFEHFIEHGLVDASSDEVEPCRRELQRIAERLGALPRVFCHRDYHAWNIHVLDGRLRVIDFQDALLGPSLYDVASLLTDRYTPELVDEAMEKRLVMRFARAVGAERWSGDGGSDTGAALEIYRLCAFQRVLKVVGRFNYLAELKGKSAYRAMLPVVVSTARRLAGDLEGVAVTARLLEDGVKSGERGVPA